MGIKIKHRQWREWLDEAIKRGFGEPSWEAFWLQVFQDAEMWQRSDKEPLKISTPWGLSTWCYKNTSFDANDCSDLTDEEIKLLIRDTIDRERRRIERLRLQYAGGDPGKYRRIQIPDDVRVFVWQRDEGACAKCGSNRNIEYDHIIPVSKGGSSTARNLQLLCEDCNRAKRDQI
jgi:hypothetical protein